MTPPLVSLATAQEREEGRTFRERPILFSGPMVLAIMEGRKTQTRRVIRPQPEGVNDREPGAVNAAWQAGFVKVRCPYGVPGDRLWLREAWRSWNEDCDDGSGAAHDWDTPCGQHCRQVYVAYAATPRQGYRPKPDGAAITFLDENTPLDRYHESLTRPWRPSIFMPRWASRITLEVTDVRVQRLREISEGDARAEAPPCWVCGAKLDGLSEADCACFHSREALASFPVLWDSINGKRAPWAANPWVWAITFRRVQP